MQFATKYELLDVEISDVDPLNSAPLVVASEGNSTASAVSPSLTRNTINNPLNPTKGSRQQLSFEYGGLGGDEEYYLFEVGNQWYQPVIESSYGDLTFSLRTRMGYGESNNEDPYPLFKRYFPGGINSVRGFKNRSLGPRDDNGNVFGGAKQFVNNTELIFPLINAAGLRGVVFYDIGNAFDDSESIDFGEMREGYGVGIRWSSPLGPIRIEFGFPADRKDDEDSMVTMFSFGAPI
jgi:outer membrane protein insertion porin family